MTCRLQTKPTHTHVENVPNKPCTYFRALKSHPLQHQLSRGACPCRQLRQTTATRGRRKPPALYSFSAGCDRSRGTLLTYMLYTATNPGRSHFLKQNVSRRLRPRRRPESTSVRTSRRGPTTSSRGVLQDVSGVCVLLGPFYTFQIFVPKY
ncbi:unnamed protein product, partial [Ectocarpus sp. 12 AP-2014]